MTEIPTPKILSAWTKCRYAQISSALLNADSKDFRVVSIAS
jgi:hypothetical protein